MEEASVMMVGINKTRIFQALNVLFSQSVGNERDLFLVKDYSYPNVSEKVLRIIISHIDYVNNVVWKKRNY